MDARLERLERLAYECYGEIRKVAEYAYANVRFEEDSESVRRMGGMRPLSDREALDAGLNFEDLVALKFKSRFLAKRVRADALVLAKMLADERKRKPAIRKGAKEEAA